MNAEKSGKLIYDIRTKKGLTQQQLADMINVSNKAICKWETGRGCPDITLLPELSKALEVDIQSILVGEQPTRRSIGGDLKNLTFFRCADCGNLISITSPSEISCCGNKLKGFNLRKDGKSLPDLNATVLETDNHFYLTFDHPMEKGNFIAAIFAIYYDRIITIPLYPEQESAVTINKIIGCKLYALDDKGQLFSIKITGVTE